MDIPKRTRLTTKFCRKLPFTTGGQYVVRDDQTSGLMVMVGVKSRSFVLQVDVMQMGKRRTIKRKIGDVDDFSISAARAEAKRLTLEFRSETAKHLDKRKALTLRQAWQDYARRLASKVQTGERSARTLKGYQGFLENGLADWMDTPMREIGNNPEAVAALHEKITHENGAYQANRVMTALRAVYRNAVKRRLGQAIPPEDPTSAVNWNSEQRRSTGMSVEELEEWGKQLIKLPNPVRREFHLFTLFSAMRPDALKKARWEHLDVKKRILHVPEPKGGKRRAFDLPLSRAMLRSLWRARQAGRILHGREAASWIFPAATPEGHMAEHKEKRHKLSHFGSDLRQTWRTCAQVAGLSELDCSILMNHSLGSVNAGYISTPALREHLCGQQERVSRQIEAALKLPSGNALNVAISTHSA